MECLFAPELTADVTIIRLSDDEMRHARALRLRSGDAVFLSNGEGLAARAAVHTVSREDVTVSVTEFLPGYGELSRRIVLALGILDNRERMEFALEKAIEFGISDFVPLQTRYSQHSRSTTERLRSKALAAMKQAQRARLPRVHEIQSLEQFLESFCTDATVILADENGKSTIPSTGDICILVGPEGGFAEEEVSRIQALPQCLTVRLAGRRLRAETAALLATGLAGLEA
jgi:16S rRNA (uracil1498-N3)-methyltransferase